MADDTVKKPKPKQMPAAKPPPRPTVNIPLQLPKFTTVPKTLKDREKLAGL